MLRFSPLTKPRWRRLANTASLATLLPPPKTPRRYTRPGSCAFAASGHATAEPPSSVMNVRRSMFPHGNDALCGRQSIVVYRRPTNENWLQSDQDYVGAPSLKWVKNGSG